MVEQHAWNQKLDLAHEAMDHEHHLQIALVTAFIDAVEQRRPWLARRLAGQIVEYSVVHFGSEELLMEASGFRERDAHAGEHAEFLVHMRQMERLLDGGDDPVALEAALDLRHSLAAHMNGADRRLAEHASGGKPAASPEKRS